MVHLLGVDGKGGGGVDAYKLFKWSHVLKGRKRATRCLRSGGICSVRIRRPPERYGELITNSVKQISKSA